MKIKEFIKKNKKMVASFLLAAVGTGAYLYKTRTLPEQDLQCYTFSGEQVLADGKPVRATKDSVADGTACYVTQGNHCYVDSDKFKKNWNEAQQKGAGFTEQSLQNIINSQEARNLVAQLMRSPQARAVFDQVIGQRDAERLLKKLQAAPDKERAIMEIFHSPDGAKIINGIIKSKDQILALAPEVMNSEDGQKILRAVDKYLATRPAPVVSNCTLAPSARK